ncbi:unnamed protein product [Phytophthora lilii]|uniref:Unnamed protein product n=1 Tax=Phytophthora lilii TaxID=2077276 RepID=A0A9W6U8S9_9STRA|nr:unnamed protein product [Phytophthora lilii]
MISTEPTLDEVGALRNQHPRRQSVLEFFSTSEEPGIPLAVAVPDTNDSSPSVVVTNLSQRRDYVAVYRSEPLVVDAPPHFEQTDDPPSTHESLGLRESARADAKAIEHFYQTRFDDSPDNSLSLPSQSRRPSRAIEARH